MSQQLHPCLFEASYCWSWFSGVRVYIGGPVCLCMHNCLCVRVFLCVRTYERHCLPHPICIFFLLPPLIPTSLLPVSNQPQHWHMTYEAIAFIFRSHDLKTANTEFRSLITDTISVSDFRSDFIPTELNGRQTDRGKSIYFQFQTIIYKKRNYWALMMLSETS